MKAQGILYIAVAAMVLFIGVRVGYAEPPAPSAIRKQEPRRITIPQGIAMILKDSRVIKIARAQTNMSYEDSLMARSALLPQVNLSITETFRKYQPASKSGEQRINTAQQQSLSYGFDVYQTLFDFGKSLSLFHSAQELVKANKAHEEGIKRLTVLEFIIAYFNLLESEKMILVAEKEVESLVSYLQDVEHLFEVGSAVRNDLLPAQVNLADAKQKLIVARNNRVVAATRLNNILTLPLHERIEVEDIAMKLPAVPSVEEAWQNAITQRPEIAFVTGEIAASSLAERAKAVENFPVLFADAGYSYDENKYTVHQNNPYVNVGAKALFYDGGAAKAGLLKERYNRQQLLEKREKLYEDIKLEIEDSHVSFMDAVEKVTVASDAVAQARENVRVYRVNYSEGAATTTDVLNAISMETTAQTNYYRADYELKRNYAKLMYSMGIDLALLYDSIDNAHYEYVKRQ